MQKQESFKKIVRIMQEANVGLGAIYLPVDQDPVADIPELSVKPALSVEVKKAIFVIKGVKGGEKNGI